MFAYSEELFGRDKWKLSKDNAVLFTGTRQDFLAFCVPVDTLNIEMCV